MPTLRTMTMIKPVSSSNPGQTAVQQKLSVPTLRSAQPALVLRPAQTATPFHTAALSAGLKSTNPAAVSALGDAFHAAGLPEHATVANLHAAVTALQQVSGASSAAQVASAPAQQSTDALWGNRGAISGTVVDKKTIGPNAIDLSYYNDINRALRYAGKPTVTGVPGSAVNKRTMAPTQLDLTGSPSAINAALAAVGRGPLTSGQRQQAGDALGLSADPSGVNKRTMDPNLIPLDDAGAINNALVKSGRAPLSGLSQLSQAVDYAHGGNAGDSIESSDPQVDPGAPQPNAGDSGLPVPPPPGDPQAYADSGDSGYQDPGGSGGGGGGGGSPMPEQQEEQAPQEESDDGDYYEETEDDGGDAEFALPAVDDGSGYSDDGGDAYSAFAYPSFDDGNGEAYPGAYAFDGGVYDAALAFQGAEYVDDAFGDLSSADYADDAGDGASYGGVDDGTIDFEASDVFEAYAGFGPEVSDEMTDYDMAYG